MRGAPGNGRPYRERSCVFRPDTGLGLPKNKSGTAAVALVATVANTERKGGTAKRRKRSAAGRGVGSQSC